MADDLKLGPYADIGVVRVGFGWRETNELLAQGWTLLKTEIVEQVMQTGQSNRQRQVQWVLMGTVGRPIHADEDGSVVREQASEATDDSMAAAAIEIAPLELAPDEAEIREAEIRPLTIPSGTDVAVPTIAARGPGRPRRIAKGVGEFESSGIRG